MDDQTVGKILWLPFVCDVQAEHNIEPPCTRMYRAKSVCDFVETSMMELWDT